MKLALTLLLRLIVTKQLSPFTTSHPVQVPNEELSRTAVRVTVAPDAKVREHCVKKPPQKISGPWMVPDPTPLFETVRVIWPVGVVEPLEPVGVL